MSRYHTGPVTNLRDAVRAERRLWFFCRWCGNARHVDPRELARKIGRDLHVKELRHRLKCRRCGLRGHAEVIVSEHGWVGRD
jgi:hypothetical protein